MRHKLGRLAWLPLVAIGTMGLAKLVNITIDDAGEDPSTHASIEYTPAIAWHYGPTCGVCEAVLNSQQTYNGTWHDVTYHPTKATSNLPQNATFSFTGSAIYIFGVVAYSGNNPGGHGGAELFFFIDGGQLGSFSSAVNKTAPKYTYNTLLWSEDTLPHGEHRLTIRNGQDGRGTASLLLLDYIIYST
ncbi:hypothetical protein PHLGIDRAFT_395076 [Phlebiopsis gigantea 11061_1 CR5-6]|uniref:Uncharacterized protein n=1 Tax=Phlebiopsis gigantea (strain 11061_1 CR5-6) TaxID=745531 RepID=A0A0C3RP10_PHLG1|nr:hypothetical protein PHLGIDRAFT_395076 [Phlebiopsis gigantea 11061_1 CR5-6]